MATYFRVTRVQRTAEHVFGYREKSIRDECFKGLCTFSIQGQKIKLIGLYITKLKILKASRSLILHKTSFSPKLSA
jgi:hypothetical protein